MDGNGYDYTFTGALASPDVYIPNVYNSYSVVTAHFGIVPLTMTSWNSGTNTGTFEIYPNWAFGNFGTADLLTTTDLQNEIAAVTTIYAAERVTTALGLGISMEGIHVENPLACQTLYWAGAGWGGATRSAIKNPYFNSDPAMPNYAPSQSPTPAQLALFYCQQSFPFIAQASNGSVAHLVLDGGDFGQFSTSPPLIIEQGPYRFLSARALSGLAALNERVADSGGYSYAELGGYNQIETQANGAGEWDGDYFLPHGMTDTYHAALTYITQGRLTVLTTATVLRLGCHRI